MVRYFCPHEAYIQVGVSDSKGVSVEVTPITVNARKGN